MPEARRERGKLPDRLTRPEEAVAIAKCLVNRMTPPRQEDPVTHRLVESVHTHHPRPCRYEDFPFDLLMKLVVDFNEWSGLNKFDRWPVEGDVVPLERTERPTLRAQLEVFMAAPIDDQNELVSQAQGYE